MLTSLKEFIIRHPVPTYFALTFFISWGGVLLVVGPSGIPGTSEDMTRLFPLVAGAMVAGPSVAGVLLAALVTGKAGLRKLLSRLCRWRVSARWYAAALLLAPALMMALLLALSLFSPRFLPGIVVSSDKTGLLLSGLAVAMIAGIFEEIGWTGFAIPILRLRHGVFETGLMVGLAWAAWHLLVAAWASGTVSGPFSLASYVLDPFLFLTSFRVLMVWVYDHTASLLIGMLMHVSVTASARIISAPELAGVPLLAADLAWLAAVWVVIAVIAAANGRKLSRQAFIKAAGES